MTKVETEQAAAISRYTANIANIRQHWVLTVYNAKEWTIDGPYWSLEIGRTALAYARVVLGRQAHLWTIENNGCVGKWVPEGKVITEETDDDTIRFVDKGVRGI